jgi:WD40 repeat protein
MLSPISLAFSPDGKTLATSGPGEVLLWDFSKPPGTK